MQDGRATLPDGSFYWLTVGMHVFLGKIYLLPEMPLYAVAMLDSEVPARSLGYFDRIGFMWLGQPAIWVVYEDHVDFALTIVSGQVAYRKA